MRADRDPLRPGGPVADGRPHALIVGCGYVGSRLAVQLATQYDITVTTRSTERVAQLKEQGIQAIALDLDRVRLGTWLP